MYFLNTYSRKLTTISCLLFLNPVVLGIIGPQNVFAREKFFEEEILPNVNIVKSLSPSAVEGLPFCTTPPLSSTTQQPSINFNGVTLQNGLIPLQLSIPYYVNPQSPTIPIDLSISQLVSGPALDYIINVLGFKTFISFWQASVVGNNQWGLTVPTATVHKQIYYSKCSLDISDLPTGEPIYVIVTMFDPFWGKLAAATANNEVNTFARLIFPTVSPGNGNPSGATINLGILGGGGNGKSSQNGMEYQFLKEGIFPIDKGLQSRLQNETSKLVGYIPAKSHFIPLQVSPWSHHPDSTERELKVSFLNTVDQKGYFEIQIQEVPYHTAQDPNFIELPEVKNMMTTGELIFTSYGPDDTNGEYYQTKIKLNSPNRELIRKGPFEETYRYAGVLMTGNSNFLSNGPLVEVFVSKISGERFLRISFSVINSIMDASKTLGYDDFYFTTMVLAADNVKGIYPHTYQHDSSTPVLQRYGTSGKQGNRAYLAFVPPVNNGAGRHWMKRGAVRIFENFIVALSDDPSEKQRAQDIANSVTAVLALHDNDPKNSLNYYTQPYRGFMGQPNLAALSTINLQNEINNIFERTYTTNLTGWDLRLAHPDMPFFVYGPNAAGTTGGGQIEFNKTYIALAHNARNNDLGIIEAIEVLNAVADASFHRQEMDILSLADGNPNTLSYMLSTNQKEWKIFNSLIHSASPNQAGIFSKSSNATIRSRHALHKAAGEPLVSYLSAAKNIQPIDEEHYVRFAVSALAGATSIPSDVKRALVRKYGHVTKIAYYWNTFWYPNSSALRSNLYSVLNP